MEKQLFVSNDTNKNLHRYQQNDFLKTQRESIKRLLKPLERFSSFQLGSEKQFLEIGLGSGEVLCYLAERWNVSGLEPSPMFFNHVKDKATTRGLRIDLRQGSVEDIPFAFEGQQFDVIIMQSVLEHVKNYKRALKNVFNHLYPKGVFVFITTNKFRLKQGEYNFPPCFYSYLPDTLRFAIRRWKQGPDIMDHGIDFHQFVPWLLKQELKEIGFKRIFDDLELIQESDINNRRVAVFRRLKKSVFLRMLYRLFYADTFFFCEK